MSDYKEKWVTIAQVQANNNDNDDSSSSDSDGFTDFISFLSTPVGTIPPPPSPTKSTKVENVESTAADNSSEEAPINSNANNKAKPVLLSLPSYYVDSFHEHFFPHADDDEYELVVRKKLSIPQRYAMSMARKPKTHLSIAFVIAVILSFLGLRFGNFKVAIDNAGWWSRGTLIANRATQETIISQNKKELFYDTNGTIWNELQSVIQPNWQGGDIPGQNGEGADEIDNSTLLSVCSGEWYGSMDMLRGREKNLNVIWKVNDAESLLEAESLYELCLAEENTLIELESTDSCYKCDGEENGKCVDPYSLVLMARLHLLDNDVSSLRTPSDAIPCDTLRSSWTATVQDEFTAQLKSCVDLSILVSSDVANKTDAIMNSGLACSFPYSFLTTMVDESFPTSNPPIVRYSSTYYATKNSQSIVEEMYNANENNDYDRAEDSNLLSGVYDTTDEDFYDYYSDSIVGRDMALAVGSAGVTIFAMMIHTKSPWLTLMGLFQILLSFPLAYFVYYFIGGLIFFPFLNFIGIFVVFALGADDVFVAVDKWKNARHELPHGTTEQVAALALPDAAYAMLLTSTTTAVAFFGTAICPVGPIVCFAVFCGLLITFDYLMNILLVFPALCLYDKWLLAGSKNCCVSFEWCCGKKKETDSDSGNDDQVVPSVTKSKGEIEVSIANNGREDGISATERVDIGESVVTFAGEKEGKGVDEDAEREELLEQEHQTLIHRILDGYYNFLHKFRWFVLVVVIAGIITCTVFAAQLSLPTSSEVSLLPDGNEYQKHATWTQSLLSTEMFKDAGTEATILWGVTPADTGDHLNPDSWTTLELDDKFDPKSKDSQTYLLGFCERLFNNFGKVKEDYQCPINLFDEWLKEESTSETPSEAYTQSCNEESSVPVSPDSFHECIISWSKLTNNTSVLSTDGSVKIMSVRAQSDVAYDAPFNELRDEWNSYETWLSKERDSTAPVGVNSVFHSDIAFWWYDTNQQMLKTAYGAAAIALVCAAVVVFISSRSFVLTLFAAVSIIYVLVAATACLVGLGWELGFLESILFAILIGISCDFVIQTGHAYTMYPGAVNRHYRSHFALTHMGPSILAAAFTTFAAAVVMIFTEITFFRKFAVILFMTIVHSVIGCFIVFLVLCDCFGPSEPTKGYDMIRDKVLNFCGKKVVENTETEGTE